MRAGVWLGFLWALWLVPVIDHLGSATPHGSYWLPFFLAFTVAMTAIRILICWVYSNTGSVLFGADVSCKFDWRPRGIQPTGVIPREEAMWYAIYG